MVKHYNPSLVERFQRIFNFKSTDRFTDDISGPVAVIPVTPISRIVRSANRSTSGSSTILTTPTDKDFYLCGAMLSIDSDVVADNTSASIVVTIDGVSNNRDIVRIEKLSLTATSRTVVQNFNPPIKIDRGTNITAASTFTVGASRLSGCIYGYTEETTNT